MKNKEDEIDHKLKNVYTLKEWEKYYGLFSYSKLRRLAAERKKNGIENAIFRAGKLFLIDKKLFLEWINNHKGQS